MTDLLQTISAGPVFGTFWPPSQENSATGLNSGFNKGVIEESARESVDSLFSLRSFPQVRNLPSLEVLATMSNSNLLQAKNTHATAGETRRWRAFLP